MEKLIHRRDDEEYNPRIEIKNITINDNSGLVSLEMLIQTRHRKKITKKLFANSEFAFESLLKELDAIQSWPEAYQRVEEELNKRHIALNKNEAVIFTNILYRRYFPDDDSVPLPK